MNLKRNIKKRIANENVNTNYWYLIRLDWQVIQTETMIFPFDSESFTPHLHNNKPLTSHFL